MTERDISRPRRDKLWDVGEELAEIRSNIPERKTERMQLRVTPTEKADVEFMTELLGVSAADYLMHLHRRAMKDLARKNKRGDERPASHGNAPGTTPLRGPRRRRKRHDGEDDGMTGVGARR